MMLAVFVAWFLYVPAILYTLRGGSRVGDMLAYNTLTITLFIIPPVGAFFWLGALVIGATES